MAYGNPAKGMPNSAAHVSAPRTRVLAAGGEFGLPTLGSAVPD
jgi:hypothetical protein